MKVIISGTSLNDCHHFKELKIIVYGRYPWTNRRLIFFVIYHPFHPDSYGNIYVANQTCLWKISINWPSHEKLILSELKYFLCDMDNFLSTYLSIKCTSLSPIPHQPIIPNDPSPFMQYQFPKWLSVLLFNKAS